MHERTMRGNGSNKCKISSSCCSSSSSSRVVAAATTSFFRRKSQIFPYSSFFPSRAERGDEGDNNFVDVLFIERIQQRHRLRKNDSIFFRVIVFFATAAAAAASRRRRRSSEQ